MFSIFHWGHYVSVAYLDSVKREKCKTSLDIKSLLPVLNVKIDNKPRGRCKTVFTYIVSEKTSFFVGPQMGKLFKGGNYLKEETSFS